MKRMNYIFLALMVFLVLGIRIYMSFQTDFLNGDESYLRLREADHVKHTLEPLYDDPLSFSGRTRTGPPLFGYITSVLSLVFGAHFGKIAPNVFAVSLIVIIFLITEKITKNSYVSFLTSFASGFIPVFFVSTINSLTVYSLVVPLTALLIYSYLRVAEKKWFYIYIAVLGVYCFLHPSVILFVTGLSFYLLLAKLENLRIKEEEYEVILFSIFSVLGSQFLIYKNVLLSYGPLVIWQNIPKQILDAYFSEATILQLILWVGAVPFLYGLFIIWKYLFSKKDREIYLLIGFALSTGALLWTKLIAFQTGLMFLGMFLVLLFGIYYKTFIEHVQATKISKWLPVFKVTIVISFILTSTVPSLLMAQKSITEDAVGQEIQALEWLKQHAPADAVVLGSVEEGNIITSVLERKNVLDSDFLSIKNSEDIFSDVKTIYTSPYKTTAVALLEKYSVDYILLSPLTKTEMEIDRFSLAEDNRCFNEVYDENNIQIYKPTCKVK